MLRLSNAVILMLGLLCASAESFAQTSATASSSAEKTPGDIRVERLAATGALWGALKFLHPKLAQEPIDWDAALLRALPKIRAASSGEEYRAAIAQMLATLNDPATYVESAVDDIVDQSLAPEAHSAPGADVPYRLVGNTLVIRCAAVLKQITHWRQLLTPEFRSTVNDAKAVVFDCRLGRSANVDTALAEAFLREGLADFVNAGFYPAAALRYPMHIGYASQKKQEKSAGYHSAIETRASQGLATRWNKKGTEKQLVVILDTALELAALIGLQEAGTVFVVEEKPGGRTIAQAGIDRPLPDKLRVHMRMLEILGVDGTLGFHPDASVNSPAEPGASDVALDAALLLVDKPSSEKQPKRSRGNFTTAPMGLVSAKDNPYFGKDVPDADHRLLALFRFWTIINYFYPYKDILDPPWTEAVLKEFIPKFEANRSRLDYEMTLLELSARLQDAHVYLDPTPAFWESLGGGAAPFVRFRKVESQVVIAAVGDVGDADVRIGDVLFALDGKPIAERLAQLERYVPKPTPQVLASPDSDALKWLLMGAEKSKLRLSLRRDDREHEVTLIRGYSYIPIKRSSPAVFEVLPSGAGYIDLTRLMAADIDAAMRAVRDTPSLIFDMRGYPSDKTGFPIAPRLAQSDMPFVTAQFRQPILSALDSTSFRGSTQTLTPAAASLRYHGRVVVLINEDAISSAEHICLLFEAAAHATFIGTPTKGSNGEVSWMVLPGSYWVRFTGTDVRHGDGRQLQRVGIQPDVRVTPTIAGIREGRDEVLEAAVRFLSGKNAAVRTGNTSADGNGR